MFAWEMTTRLTGQFKILLFNKCIVDNIRESTSSLSYELFFMSLMQEDVYIGYIALALTLGLQVFS